jgi:hypothetical protein
MPSMDVFSDDQQVALIARLMTLTRDGRLSWEPKGRFHFLADSHRFTYDLNSRDDDDEHPYDLAVRNLDGEIVAVLSSDAAGGLEGLNRGLQQLYVLAKRTALKLDKVVVDVFKDLDEL